MRRESCIVKHLHVKVSSFRTVRVRARVCERETDGGCRHTLDGGFRLTAPPMMLRHKRSAAPLLVLLCLSFIVQPPLGSCC